MDCRISTETMRDYWQKGLGQVLMDLKLKTVIPVTPLEKMQTYGRDNESGRTCKLVGIIKFMNIFTLDCAKGYCV